MPSWIPLGPCWDCGKDTSNRVLPSAKGVDYPDDEFIPMCRLCSKKRTTKMKEKE